MAYIITEAQATELLKIADALVGKQIQKGLIQESDRKDYIQELMLIMVEHQNDWTIPEGVRFEAYANTVMEKRLISIWRKLTHKKNVMLDALSLNATYINDVGEEEEFLNKLTEYGMMDDEKISNLQTLDRLITEVRLFVATLPEEYQQLCKLLMQFSVTEVADKINKSRSYVWHKIYFIRTKAIEAGFRPMDKKYEKNHKSRNKTTKKCDSHRCKDNDFYNNEGKIK